MMSVAPTILFIVVIFTVCHRDSQARAIVSTGACARVASLAQLGSTVSVVMLALLLVGESDVFDLWLVALGSLRFLMLSLFEAHIALRFNPLKQDLLA